MPPAVSRAEAEAFKNLKLDNEFFARALQRVDDSGDPDSLDFDIYLLEKSVMPLLLQGLEALTRHVDKASSRPGGLKGDERSPFNPLVWLAQYLLRNHPAHVQDHRTPMYHKFSEMAAVERGRRCLMRRRAQMEEEWCAMEKEFCDIGRESMTVTDIPLYVKRLDEKWALEGVFARKLPEDFEGVQRPGVSDVAFVDFWEWFEAYISERDVVRATVFAEAEAKREEEARRARAIQEELERREKAIQEVHDRRRTLEEQFDALSADIYINDVLGQVMNKGVSIEVPEDKEGGECHKGEHVALVLVMLGLWGCPIADGAAEDAWGEEAASAWQAWQDNHGPEGMVPGRLDSTGLRGMLNRDAFQTHLLTAHPINVDNEIIHHTVEVRSILEETEDSLDFLVEAIDDETGEILHLSLPEGQIEEVRRRLNEAGAEPVLARVDLVSSRVKDILPPEAASEV